jgi:glycosyltransferase involved in cell wall biosynthesis
MKISIVTVVRNSAGTIASCLASVGQQVHADIEHIVVDGCSTDGTIDVIHAEGTHLAWFLSEPDKGIYDALNKGLRFATGEVIGILHSDDLFAEPEILQRVHQQLSNDTIEACYGDLLYVDREDTSKVIRYWKSGQYDPQRFYWGWMPPHPTFFVKRTVYEKYGLFNLDMGSAADYELMLRFLVKNCVRTTYIPDVLVKMRVGGTSNASLANRIRANRNDRKAWEVNGLIPYPWTLLLKPVRKIPQYFMRP